MYDEPAVGGAANFTLLAVAGTAAFLAVAAVAAAAHLWRLRRHSLAEASLRLAGLSVLLPKPREEDGQRRDVKELLGLMEPVFGLLQHFQAKGWRAKLFDMQPTFAFEIMSRGGRIYFNVLADREHLAQLERQIHAQYPDAHLEETREYDVFTATGEASAVAALGALKSRIFPVRTFKGMDGDPLGAIASSLTKVREGSAAIQVLVRPSDGGLQKEIEEALQNVQQGNELKGKQKGLGAALQGAAKEIGQTAFQASTNEKASNDAKNSASGNVRLTALQEQQAKQLVEKGSKLAFQVQIRAVARGATHVEAKQQVQAMLSAFSQYHAPEANGFKVAANDDRGLLPAYVMRSFSARQPTLTLNTEELASLFHFPNSKLDVPNVHWLGSRKLAPPHDLPASGVALGYSTFRGDAQPVYMAYPDRMRHLYMIGKTGVGKTVMFQNMALQDIRAGHGVCYMDPNGDAIEWMLRHIPRERAEDVILFDPSDTARPLALNLLEYDGRFPEQKTMVINEVISIFDKLYDLKATGGPMFEQYMRNAMLLIMDDPERGATLMEIPKVMADAEYRRSLLDTCRNPVVTDFWVNEAEKAGGEAALANIVPYITSKLTQFTTNDIMRPIIGQSRSAFSFREAMDARKIILVTLPKGLLGDMNAQLLGMIISGKIQIAAFSRQDQPEPDRTPFFLYVDEFQNFTSKTFATILSEARKYALSLNVTNQYVAQLDEETRDAVMGNVGTMISWRVSAGDAEFLRKEMEPVGVEDMVNAEKYNFYLRMLIEGAPAAPFNVTSYPPDPHDNPQLGEAVRQLARLKYGRDRDRVEDDIRRRIRPVLRSAYPEPAR